MQYVILYVAGMLLELGGVWWINWREAELSLEIKKYGIILAIGNALLLALAWYKESLGGAAVAWYFGLFTYLLCLTIYDLKFRELPDWWHLLLVVAYAGMWIGGVQHISLLESGLMTVILAAVLGLICLIRKDAIGIGDMKLILVCAVYAGFSCGGIITRGMIVAFFWSLGMLLLKKATTKSELPFVPFLLVGALLL